MSTDPKLLNLPKKRTLVLLEILIGLSLAGILLSLLFSFMTQSMKMEKKFEATHDKVLSSQRLQMRLQDLFMALQVNETTPLFTEKFSKEKKESLIITFDNGIDPDPAFSGSVIGRLYMDEQNNLGLAIWPIDAKKEKALPWRKEILFPKIDDFQFEFLGEKIKSTDKEIGSKNSRGSLHAWHQKWDPKRGGIPSQIRLTLLTHEKVPLRFAFFPASPEPIVTYWETLKTL